MGVFGDTRRARPASKRYGKFGTDLNSCMSKFNHRNLPSKDYSQPPRKKGPDGLGHSPAAAYIRPRQRLAATRAANRIVDVDCHLRYNSKVFLGRQLGRLRVLRYRCDLTSFYPMVAFIAKLASSVPRPRFLFV